MVDLPFAQFFFVSNSQRRTSLSSWNHTNGRKDLCGSQMTSLVRLGQQGDDSVHAAHFLACIMLAEQVRSIAWVRGESDLSTALRAPPGAKEPG